MLPLAVGAMHCRAICSQLSPFCFSCFIDRARLVVDAQAASGNDRRHIVMTRLACGNVQY